MPVLTHADFQLNYQLIGPDLTPTDRSGWVQTVPQSALSATAPAPAPAPAPVALIHGLGTNLAFWYLGAMRHLARDRTFILHDLRGHGASSMPAKGYGLDQMADDFRLLLDRLGIVRAHVVGHSHGARVALAFALTHPDRVESLTIADTQIRALQPPMRLGDWSYWTEWKADLVSRGVTSFPSEDAIIDFRLLAELGPRSAGGKMLAETPVLHAPDWSVDWSVDMPTDHFRPRQVARREGRLEGRLEGRGDGRRIDLQSRQMGARGADQWKALLETTAAPDEMHDESAIPPDALQRLTMPVLLMYGDVSHCVPTSDRLMEAIPQARRILIPGAGHFFPIVKPRLFARALRVFLARVEADQPRAAQNEASPRSAHAGQNLGQTPVPITEQIANQTLVPHTGLPRFGQARRLGSGLMARAAGRLSRGGK